MSDEFTIKDSGKRTEFEGGMVRDTEDDKVDYGNVAFGPMLYRWAMHCTKGRVKYPDPKPGVPNWTLAKGTKEFLRFRASAFRHFMAWFMGLRDEDHAAGVFFNINGAEYVRANMWADSTGNKVPGEPPMTPNLGLPSEDRPLVSAPPGAIIETDGVTSRFEVRTRKPWMNEDNCAGLRARPRCVAEGRPCHDHCVCDFVAVTS